jgi:hypothetical protein
LIPKAVLARDPGGAIVVYSRSCARTGATSVSTKTATARSPEIPDIDDNVFLMTFIFVLLFLQMSKTPSAVSAK